MIGRRLITGGLSLRSESALQLHFRYLDFGPTDDGDPTTLTAAYHRLGDFWRRRRFFHHGYRCRCGQRLFLVIQRVAQGQLQLAFGLGLDQGFRLLTGHFQRYGTHHHGLGLVGARRLVHGQHPQILEDGF